MKLKNPRNKWKLRAFQIGLLLASFSLALLITLKVFNDNVVFFFSPSELLPRSAEFKNKEVRVGGLVLEGSPKFMSDNKTLEFKISDLEEELTVRYKGTIPSLFAENQGTVAKGKLNADNIFIAVELLAKHDETYMPREVADKLKLKGRWKPSSELADKISKEEVIKKPPFDINSNY